MVIHGNPDAVINANAGPTAGAAGASSNTCVQAPAKIFNGTDIGGAAFKGIDYRTLDISKEATPLTACAAACCAWNGCGAWVVQSGTGASQHDHNCTATTTTCCWLKPDAAGPHTPNPKSTAGVVTASPARPVIPPPPPPPPHGPNSPHNISGYHIVIVGATKTLLVEKRQVVAGKHVVQVLSPKFDLATLENGLVLEAWNILRVTTTWSTDNTAADSNGGDDAVLATETVPHRRLCINVWFNPMFKETGFVGNSSDAGRTPQQLPPRLTVFDSAPLPVGEMYLTAGGRDSKVDYASVLPINVL